MYGRDDYTVQEAAQTAEWTQLTETEAVLWDDGEQEYLSGETVPVQE